MATSSPALIASFRIRITIGITLILLAGVAVACFFLFPGSRVPLAFAAAVVAAAGGVSAYFSSATLYATLQHERQRTSLQLNDSFDDPELTDLRNFLDKADLANKSDREAYDAVVGDPKLHVAARSLMNRFETLATAIQVGAADEVILYLTLKSMVRFYAEHLHGYIRHVRHTQQTAFVELEALAASWSAGKSIISGAALPASAKAYRGA